MSDRTWEYVPDTASIVGRLAQAQVDEVESLASRIADAVAVRRIGTSFDVRESVSNVKTYGEGPVMIWFLEDYRTTLESYRLSHQPRPGYGPMFICPFVVLTDSAGQLYNAMRGAGAGGV